MNMGLYLVGLLAIVAGILIWEHVVVPIWHFLKPVRGPHPLFSNRKHDEEQRRPTP